METEELFEDEFLSELEVPDVRELILTQCIALRSNDLNYDGDYYEN